MKGQSLVVECREVIGLCITLERHVARLFGRGGRPAGVLRFKNKLGNETASRIKATLQAAHGGENSGRQADETASRCCETASVRLP